MMAWRHPTKSGPPRHFTSVFQGRPPPPPPRRTPSPPPTRLARRLPGLEGRLGTGAPLALTHGGRQVSRITAIMALLAGRQVATAAAAASATSSALLARLVRQFDAPIDYALAYGSAVKPQKNHDAKVRLRAPGRWRKSVSPHPGLLLQAPATAS